MSDLDNQLPPFPVYFPEVDTLDPVRIAADLAKYVAENPRWWAAPIRRKGYTIFFTYREDQGAAEAVVRELLSKVALNGVPPLPRPGR